MAFNYNANTKSYNYTPKDNPKDRVEVEIGDSMDSSQFFPQVKIKRWDNEVNASIRLKHDTIPGNVSYSDDGEKITWIKKQGQNEWKAVFYHRSDLDEGGFEFEVHLPAKPPVNYLEFTVNTKELDWFYQPPLTQEEIDQGAERPENVIGSYAVYHKTKGGMNDAAGMEYKVGKAFHVYRPHVVDANGNETWGTLELDEVNGILKISVDQTWLNNAVYPVIVDPTFGYTTLGATNGQIIRTSGGFQRSTRRGVAVTPAGAGTLSKISAGLDANGTDSSVDVSVFLNIEDTATDSLTQVSTAERTDVAVSTTEGFQDFTVSDTFTAVALVLSAVGDWATVTAGRDVYLNYDASGTQNTYLELKSGAGAYAANKESPWTVAEAGGDTTRYSIYATYTLTGSPSPLLLNTTVSTSTILTLASGTFTPTANSLLLVVLATLSADTGAVRNHSSASSTITGQGAFTERVDLLQDVSNREEEISIYTSQTGSSPNAGTVTMNWDNSSATRTVMQVYEVTGHDTTTPIGATGTNQGTGTTLEVTLSGTPASDSLVFAAVNSADDATPNDITAGSGFIEYSQVDSGGTTAIANMQTMYDSASADTTADWAGLNALNSVGVAIEIKAAAAAGAAPAKGYMTANTAFWGT